MDFFWCLQNEIESKSLLSHKSYDNYNASFCSFTAVGVFVLSRMFREAWGTQALKKEAEFNDFLEVFPRQNF